MSRSSSGSSTVAPTASTRSVASLRDEFPALARQHEGAPVAYFDGPGGTQVPTRVVEAIGDYLLHHNADTHWRYPTSAETDVALTAARGAFADFLNCGVDEVAFGANMTTLTFHVSRALARQWNPGDEIVVTELDHHANVDPWRHAARDRGLTVKAVRLQPDSVNSGGAELDWDHFASIVGPRTKLVAIGAASNALGTVNDVARAVALAHAAGALAFVDAVHYAPHTLVDVAALGCDLLACSAYKFYGPHVGVLFGRRHVLGGLDVPRLQPAPDGAPERVETGTQNHEGIVGAAAAVDFLASIGAPASRPAEADRREGTRAPGTAAGVEANERRAALTRAFDALHTQGEALLARLWTGLAQIDGVRLYGRQPGLPRTPTVGFTLRGHDAGDVAAALAARALFVSHGDFYAATVVERLAPSAGGLVRAGCACYTTEEEIDRLIDGVREIARTYTHAVAFTCLDFFAGSGLVRLGLEPDFRSVWANDIDRRKEAVYRTNFGGDTFHLGSIEDVRSAEAPAADLAWASFPCQDLSLAGSLNGMKAGTRSGLFWQWLRVLDEMRAADRRVPLLVAENVVGFVVARQGHDFRQAYTALRERGYRAGALIIDARLFVPQSRPRAFLVAVRDDVNLSGLTERAPSAPFHPRGLVRAVDSLADPNWIWWTLPSPPAEPPAFAALCERDAPCDPPEKTRSLERLLSPLNRRKLKTVLDAGGSFVGAGYRRMRPDVDGRSVQRLEIRFDGVAGCLRTPEGGSSRQVVMMVDRGRLRTRLMTVRECARLMGAPDSFEVPGSYNDGYRAMGDAVVAPVTRWMAEHLLAPLAERAGATARVRVRRAPSTAA